MLEVRRQRQPLAQCLERLVGGEPGTQRRDLEEHAARLAEVDRAEIEAVDDGSRPRTRALDALAPRLVVVHRRRPSHVMDGPGAADAAFRRRLVIGIPAAALFTPDLPAIVAGLEDESLFEEAP